MTVEIESLRKVFNYMKLFQLNPEADLLTEEENWWFRQCNLLCKKLLVTCKISFNLIYSTNKWNCIFLRDYNDSTRSFIDSTTKSSPLCWMLCFVFRLIIMKNVRTLIILRGRDLQLESRCVSVSQNQLERISLVHIRVLQQQMRRLSLKWNKET